MNQIAEKRAEKRLRYHWPVWYSEAADDYHSQGQMVDISSTAAAFTCYSDRCPDEGEDVTARFSVPRYNGKESFAMENFVRTGKIYRIQPVSPFIKRVAVIFSEKLPFKPGEQHVRHAISSPDHSPARDAAARMSSETTKVKS